MIESDRDELIEETLGLLRRVFRRAVPRFGPHLHSQLPMLHHLTLHAAQAPGGITQSELAQFLGVSPAHVTGIIDQMEHDHLVRRRRDREDRRMVRVQTTRVGMHVHSHIHRRLAHHQGVFDGWETQDLLQLRDLLKRLDERTSLRGRGEDSSAPRRSDRATET
jgi:DNA-binding MarR family transcriptional regulator